MRSVLNLKIYSVLVPMFPEQSKTKQETELGDIGVSGHHLVAVSISLFSFSVGG